MITQEQIRLMIESLEELQDILSRYSNGTLFTDQFELLEYLKQLKK